MNKSVLFVSHKPKQCGVYEFGKNAFNAVSPSLKYNFIKAECESLTELHDAIRIHQPVVIIYNYHPSVMPWLCTKISKGLYRNHIAGVKCLQLGIIHEVTQQVADSATAYRNDIILGGSEKKLNSLFDFYIAPDPTLLLKNPFVFKTGRLIATFRNPAAEPKALTIGSIGFATPGKGFDLLVRRVQEEFDHAIIRINMPAASFGDPDGKNAERIAAECRKIIAKPGISLEITHDYLTTDQLLRFLSANTLNVFMYENAPGRGISSAVDNAIAVRKPIAVSRSAMFRHLLPASPSICTDDLSLANIISNGFKPLEDISADWNEGNFRWDIERIIDAAILKSGQKTIKKFSIKRSAKSLWNKIFSLPDDSFTWLRNTVAANDDDLTADTSLTYKPVKLADNAVFNRILDDKARAAYAPATAKLFELVPVTMSKKIDRANVQQAFVFDTVYRHLHQYTKPKILCVGSYEDTASMALQKMGITVEEIDPMINFFLQEFYTRPGTLKNSYDVIFSTSVIEHDPDDKSFVECIEGLLAVNGIAVITCDYKDGWLPGQPKPDADARFYTKKDLASRLMSYLPNSVLLDKPDWDCLNPDFNYLGKYQYTFATFVFRKINK